MTIHGRKLAYMKGSLEMDVGSSGRHGPNILEWTLAGASVPFAAITICDGSG